ncbi:hypothetical protein PDESU_01601 [Pontiella desulfatans]|uniref:Uncharacterized protein n=1 Tax=Pontiella desulfatans TaxID=2750659 RepID=A0A6C2TZK4_PONDE|nr:putative glycoside hydrolase [Pontiella desulfatans]VGO13047.1 hypothetical protein PDESU_01601 [Pontiella desulfatans]
MKRSLYALRFCLLVAGATWADIHTTLDFADLNAALSNNTLMVNGSTSNLLVTGGGSGNDYIYSVAYAGADFDADGTNDTLVFDLLVEGFSGTVATNAGLGASSAAIGSADAGVFVAGQKWHVVDDRMNAGETLRFTVLNPTSSVGSVAFEGFGSVAAHEGASYGHEAVIGEGTGLDGYTFNDNLTMAVSPAESPLFVSSATANATKAQWGVGHVDFGLTVRVEAERRVVEWDGTVDGNWNMPGNWLTGAVPGTDPGDWVILSGSNDAPVVATVVETTNSCAIRIDDGASLEVADGKLRCEGIVLDGGQLQLVGGADVEVSGDLRVGDSPGSSVGLRSGSLAVDGEVYVGNGLFEVEGDAHAIALNDFTLASNATLRFDFDLKPASTIQVADRLTIAEGAKLEIDLRGYNTGGNELELVTFGSVNGSFDPADIAITGLGGGVVSMDGDSLNLTVIDDVAARSCALWFVATGGSGADPLDLQVNTGRRIRNISSPDMSYALTVDGDEKVYSASWSGSDFDGDGVNDTVSFDLRVEGFSGSTHTYDSTTGTASMTALGSADAVAGDGSGWGVGADGDLDAGQTLRFSVENLTLSTPGGVMEGFVGMQLVEPGGGNNHVLMVGAGDDLDAWTSNYSTSIGFSPEDPLLVTSGADSKVQVNRVAFKLMVSELPDIWDTETGDYSHLPTGPQHRSEYAAVTNIHYPDWSWDTLPMSAGVHRNDTIPEEVAELMANTYPVISLGGRNFYGEADVEAGMSAVSATLKKYNPDVFTTTYKNAGLHHDRTAANAYFDEEEWTLYHLDEDGNRVYDTIRGWYRYNHNHPQCREWWSDWCVARLEDPNIDAIFIDKATGGEQALLNDDGEIEAGSNRVKSYVSIWERLPAGDMLTGNILRTSRFGGNRELLHLFNGAYSEGWESGNGDSLVAMNRADGICASLQLFREARVKGLIVNPNYANLNHFVLSGDDAKAMIAEGRADEVVDVIREEIQLPLAYHLITLAPYSYFSFQVVNSGEFGAEEFLWNTKPYIEEFRHPLGEPLGPPVQDGYVFTRSYEHVEVWLNVETEECRMTWDWMPIADAQAVEVDEGSSVAITLTGSEPRGSNFTFVVASQPTNGVLTGTAPNLVYTPNPGASGEDGFTFKTANDLAESLKATVSISVNNAYSTWTTRYGLTGTNALPGADVENDGYDNLAEYALGMNPTNADAGSRESIGIAVDEGTNYLEYVHARRTDHVAQGLDYLLIDSTSLVDSASTTNAQDQVQVGPAIDGYEPVTNRYLTDDSAMFIQLEIRQE